MNPGIKMRLYSDQGVEMELWLSGMYQPALAHVLSQNAVTGGYFIEAGANVGFFSFMFAKWAGTSGKIAAFEANPQMVARIKDSNQHNDFRIDIVEKAIHDKAGDTITFYISASPRKSSIYGDQVEDVTQQITVETMTIDDYVAAAQWSRVDIIKMDIEGNDCRGLLGAANTIREYRPFIVFEYWRDSHSDAQQQAAQLLTDVGYRLEILHINGKRDIFDWQLPPHLHHVDVLCFPPEGFAEHRN
jgi:FkbM family methyltransferase